MSTLHPISMYIHFAKKKSLEKIIKICCSIFDRSRMDNIVTINVSSFFQSHPGFINSILVLTVVSTSTEYFSVDMLCRRQDVS